MVQGSQVSGPARLDLRVNPNGVFIGEKARPPMKHMTEIWPSRPMRLGSEHSRCSGAGLKEAPAWRSWCQNYPGLPFAEDAPGWRPAHYPSIWSAKPVLLSLKLTTVWLTPNEVGGLCWDWSEGLRYLRPPWGKCSGSGIVGGILHPLARSLSSSVSVPMSFF